jgi:hypothetical protein
MSIDTQTAFKATVTPKYGELQSVVDWCDRNCQADWKYMEDIHDQCNSFVFLFETERDYVNFLLWKK